MALPAYERLMTESPVNQRRLAAWFSIEEQAWQPLLVL